LGSDNWARIRIGVGPENGDGPVESARRRGKDYLLTPMWKQDLAVLDEVLDRAGRAAETVVTRGIGVAMNEWNRRAPQPG
jgi:peptidyl-tRNA hydrolase, PTH1 family